LRELVAWFFKINGLKKELRKIHQEIAVLQTEVKRLQQPSPKPPEPLKELAAQDSAATQTSKFRINH
jgi:cell division protein FtsB